MNSPGQYQTTLVIQQQGLTSVTCNGFLMWQKSGLTFWPHINDGALIHIVSQQARISGSDKNLAYITFWPHFIQTVTSCDPQHYRFLSCRTLSWVRTSTVISIVCTAYLHTSQELKLCVKWYSLMSFFMNPLVQTISCVMLLSHYIKRKNPNKTIRSQSIKKCGKSQNEFGTMGGPLNARFSLLRT